MAPIDEIDIQESTLRRKGDLLETLLIDRTTKKNIIWATDSYVSRGKEFEAKKSIKPELITGIHNKLIQPRVAKSLQEQKIRTKEKAEVFTPLKIVDQMNKLIDWSGDGGYSDGFRWQEYVKELKLEITCGEAPYIVSRYNPTSHTRKLIKIKNRVGFLDRKLRVVSQHCEKPKEWLVWAKEAFKASYGYEWQGDNILIARENLLYTLLDYYKDKFGRNPSLDVQQEFAEIISWNIFQMDGLKYVIPMSCEGKTALKVTQMSILPIEEEKQEQLSICEGCTTGDVNKHTGKYVKIMGWEEANTIEFAILVSDRSPFGVRPS